MNTRRKISHGFRHPSPQRAQRTTSLGRVQSLPINQQFALFRVRYRSTPQSSFPAAANLCPRAVCTNAFMSQIADASRSPRFTGPIPAGSLCQRLLRAMNTNKFASLINGKLYHRSLLPPPASHTSLARGLSSLDVVGKQLVLARFDFRCPTTDCWACFPRPSSPPPPNRTLFSSPLQTKAFAHSSIH